MCTQAQEIDAKMCSADQTICRPDEQAGWTTEPAILRQHCCFTASSQPPILRQGRQANAGRRPHRLRSVVLQFVSNQKSLFKNPVINFGPYLDFSTAFLTTPI